MAADRFYIYRVGATDACALTAIKGDPRLPATVARMVGNFGCK